MVSIYSKEPLRKRAGAWEQDTWLQRDMITRAKTTGFAISDCSYLPQPQPQPPLPTDGQAGLVLQLSQAFEAADGTRAENDESALRGLVAPHEGHFFAWSCKVLARCSNA